MKNMVLFCFLLSFFYSCTNHSGSQEELETLFNDARYEDCIDAANRQLSKNTENWRSFYWKGQCEFALDSMEAAVNSLSSSILISSNDTNLSARADIYGYLGFLEAAIEDYNLMLEKSPENWEALNNRGYTFNRIGRYNEALQDLELALSYSPNSSAILNNLGMCFSGMNKLEESISYYNEAISLNPYNAVYFFNRGNSLVMLRNYDEALKDLFKAQELGLNDKNLLTNLALAQYGTGDAGGACKTWLLSVDQGSDIAASYIEKYCDSNTVNEVSSQ